jgi:hypothetical protein
VTIVWTGGAPRAALAGTVPARRRGRHLGEPRSIPWSLWVATGAHFRQPPRPNRIYPATSGLDQERLAATSFWTLGSNEKPRLMLDGSDWTIRGRQGGRSHCIKRRSPYGPIRDLGELFVELAGSEAINEYFEYPATFPIRS